MPTSKSGDPKVSVRMYRQGLGDCFLVGLQTGAKKYHILIDCGVWDPSARAAQKLRDCVADIRRRTKGAIDMLVVTHEHWDHVSGFSPQQARSIFEKELRIARVVLSWTEKPGDPLADALRGKQKAVKQRLAEAAANATRAGLEIGRSVAPLLGFGNDPSDALGWVKQLEQKQGAAMTYAEPGEVIQLPGARMYVLGPPRSEEALRKVLGGAKAKESNETYLGAAEVADVGLELDGLETALFAAAARGSGRPAWDENAPFRGGVGFGFPRPDGEPRQGQRLEAYLRSRSFLDAAYHKKGSKDDESWRRIDEDWAGSMASLALRMDKFTNNTSLVLAIELEGSKRVLLFPADAQYGNWMSWDDVKFESFPDVSVPGLIERTVLYKVGHHGSHNATLRKRGIDRMTSPDLVAMIPTDEQYALKQPPAGSWKMPYKLLDSDLKVKTRGRVIRADLGLPKEPDVDKAVRKGFFKSVTESKLFVELRI